MDLGPCSSARLASRAAGLAGGLGALLAVGLGVAESTAQAQPLPMQTGGPLLIRSRMHSMVLDIQGANRQPGTGVVAWPANENGNGSDNQHWELVGAPGGGYFIRSRMHGLVLDIDGGRREPGTRLIVWPAKPQGNANQIWDLVPCGGPGPGRGRGFHIKSRLNNYVLDVEGGNRSPGTRIIAYPAHPYCSSLNQLWDVLSPVQQLSPPPPPPPPPGYRPPPPPHRPPHGGAPISEAREAGPIWNNGDAQGKCARVCAPPSSWTGQWWTTRPNEMSVCECLTPARVPPPPPPPPPLPRSEQREAGPIWNNQDAAQKCTAVCAPAMRWSGQWRTTIPNRMSVCECVSP